MKNKKYFGEKLIKWDRNHNTRHMPWKGERDPYRVWVSEIILQQTRVEQGTAYYQRFIGRWPDVKSLAAAREDEVYKAWEGLGYYTRCRNLIATARHIAGALDGRFPDRYEDILQLRGVGTYTAAAIASFAFRLPHAVLDGNVFRVLARFFGIDTPVDSPGGKKLFSTLSAELLDRSNPGAYNQAIMDFGAVVCKPQQPACGICPLAAKCVAMRDQRIRELPVKGKSIKQRTRYFHYFIVEQGGAVYVRKRTGNDIWKNLYEFPLLETGRPVPARRLLQMAGTRRLLGEGYRVKKISEDYLQKLTHQVIHGRFYHLSAKAGWTVPEGFEKVAAGQLQERPFPKFITSYLRD